MIRYFFYLLFLFTNALAFAEEDHFVVRLSLEKELTPLYFYEEIAPQAISKDYLQNIYKIFIFDLNYNGFSSVKKETASLQKEASSLNLEKECLSLRNTLKKMGIPIVLKPYFDKNKLFIDVFSLSLEKPVRMGPIALENNLSQDRKKVHELTDALQLLLFQTKGVATTHILYSEANTTKKNVWVSEIYECDYDGANAKKITQGTTYSVTPCYIPPENSQKKSTYFLFTGYTTGQPKIFLGNLQTGQETRLIPMTGNQLMPAISYQRDQIAFISDVAGNPDLFLQDFDPIKGLIGKPRQIFSAKLATQGSPSFSPDGKKIAFVSNKDGSARVYVISIPACNVPLTKIHPTLISKTTKGATAPSWSPDGKKIAYCSAFNGTRQIFIYDFTEEREYCLTEGKENKENPSWAKDSLHLVYNTSSKDGGKLYMINLNQKEAILLPLGKGEKRFPSWEK